MVSLNGVFFVSEPDGATFFAKRPHPPERSESWAASILQNWSRLPVRQGVRNAFEIYGEKVHHA